MYDEKWGKAVLQSQLIQKNQAQLKEYLLSQDKLNTLLTTNKVKRIDKGFIFPNGQTLTLLSKNTEKDIIKYKAKRFYVTILGVLMKILIVTMLLTLASCASPQNTKNPSITHHPDFEAWAGTVFTEVYEVKINDTMTYLTFTEQSGLVKDKKHEFIMCNKSKLFYEKEVFLTSKSVTCE